MKKIVFASALSFIAGVYISDQVKELRGALHYETKEGFARHPYDLRIVHKDSPKGIESYLLDTRTNEHWQIKDEKKKKDNPLIKLAIKYFIE